MTFSPWFVTSGRVVGMSHRSKGIPCQDDTRHWLGSDGHSFIIAVSDGAGSGRLTHFASAVAVRSSVHHLRQAIAGGSLLDRNLFAQTLDRARGDVALLTANCVAAVGQASLRDFACTLIVVAVYDGFLHVAQIGDGAVVIREGGELKCLSPHSTGEYVNETTFLVTRGAIDGFHYTAEKADGVSAIAAMTDGVQHLAIHHRDNSPHPGFFNPVFDYLSTQSAAPEGSRNEELRAFLDSELVNSETDDDKTLVVALKPLTLPSQPAK